MSNKLFLSLAGALVLACAGTSVFAQAPAASDDHAVAGDVTNVSADGKTMTVKTADGTDKTFKVDSNTTVNGAKGNVADEKGKHVVVHYTAKGGEETAKGVKDAGKGTWKVTEGTVEKVGDGGKWVSIKTKDGSVKTYEVSKKATIETGKGIEEGGKYTGKAGEKVVVYSMVDPTKEVGHFFKKL